MPVAASERLASFGSPRVARYVRAQQRAMRRRATSGSFYRRDSLGETITRSSSGAAIGRIPGFSVRREGVISFVSAPP
jgi:hypothetical protein